MILAVGLYGDFGVVGLIVVLLIGAFNLSRGRWH
jgi:hypothetical protein